MRICASCKERFDATEDSCPHCRAPVEAPVRLSTLSRYSLGVGLVLSALGVFAGVVSSLIWLTHGEIGYACLSLFVGAPYSLAMMTVFRHVLDRT